MLNRFWFLFLLLALSLSACQQQSTPEASPVTPEPAVTEAVTDVPTSPPVVTQTPAEPTQVSAMQAPPGCTVVSPEPTPGPTQQSLFPPVTEADWVMGSPDARVTILEYSDFQ